MPGPPNFTQEQKDGITAALFRREKPTVVAKEYGLSGRQVSRMISNLRAHGTITRPRTAKLGRPTVLKPDVEEALKQFVTENPLALLEDMQRWLADNFGLKCSRASISRRMDQLGFERGMIRKGIRCPANANVSTDSDLAQLTVEDYERIRRAAEDGGRMILDGEGAGVMQRGLLLLKNHRLNTETMIQELPGQENNKDGIYSKKTKYAWLTKDKGKEKANKQRKKRKARGSKATTAADNVENSNTSDLEQMIGLEQEGNATMTIQEQEDLEHAADEAEGELGQNFSDLHRLGQYASEMSRIGAGTSQYPPLHDETTEHHRQMEGHPSNVTWFTG